MSESTSTSTETAPAATDTAPDVASDPITPADTETTPQADEAPADAVEGDGTDDSDDTTDTDSNDSTPGRGRVRERLRAAEAAVTELTDQLARQHRDIIDDEAARIGCPADVFEFHLGKAGRAIGEFITDEGMVDREAVRVAAEAIRLEAGNLSCRPIPVRALGGDGINPGRDAPRTWDAWLSDVARQISGSVKR